LWNMVRALASPRICFLCRYFDGTSKRATECTSATLLNRPMCAKHRNLMVCSGPFITNADRMLNAQVSELKHHLETLEPDDISLQCNVCFENQERWVRFGCGHYVCEDCHDRLELCHICREPLHRRDSRRFRIVVRPPPPVTSPASPTYAPSSPAYSPTSPGYDPSEGSIPPHRGRSPSPPRTSLSPLAVLATRPGNHRGRSPRRRRSETAAPPQTRDEELLARAIRESQRTYTLEQNARLLYTDQSVIVFD
jgi:hypothetical protein